MKKEIKKLNSNDLKTVYGGPRVKWNPVTLK
jgi:bacteriocin-like protein